jgi:hypothetical protein
MEDLFGNKKPIQIEDDEWWLNGRIILFQKEKKSIIMTNM